MRNQIFHLRQDPNPRAPGVLNCKEHVVLYARTSQSYAKPRESIPNNLCLRSFQSSRVALGSCARFGSEAIPRPKSRAWWAHMNPSTFQVCHHSHQLRLQMLIAQILAKQDVKRRNAPPQVRDSAMEISCAAEQVQQCPRSSSSEANLRERVRFERCKPDQLT